MRLIGVGVGPGDPELLTLKAARVLGAAGRIFVPVLDAAEAGRAEATVAAHAPVERIERLVFALNERHDQARRHRHWDAAGAQVAQWLRAHGGTAAFATIGDPNLYSTFGYLAQTVRDLLPEVSIESVPGVTAMQALAAACGTALTEGSEPLVLLPLTGDRAGLVRALDSGATVVVYKGGRRLAEVAGMVRAAGREAFFGSGLGLPEERVSRLSDVDEEAAPYLSTVLVPARRQGRGGKL